MFHIENWVIKQSGLVSRDPKTEITAFLFVYIVEINILNLFYLGFGAHGYNNSFKEMHPYFIAHGPAFKHSYNSTQFMNLDVYLLMCYILDIQPVPNNASFDRFRQILADDGARWMRSSWSWCTQRGGLAKLSYSFYTVFAF